MLPLVDELHRASERMRALMGPPESHRLAQQLLDQARASQRLYDLFVKPQLQMREFFARLAKEDADFLALESRAYELGELGWTVPLWADTPVIRSFLEETDRAQVSRELLRYFSVRRGRNARALIGSVVKEPKLSHWSRLLRQASAAFGRRQYSIVVPALFCVLEGRVAQATGSLQSGRKIKDNAAAGRRRSRSGIALAAWASIHGFVESTYRTHPFDREAPLRLNRHWTLHGRAQPHWTRVDCLMLWQAIGTITDVTP